MDYSLIFIWTFKANWSIKQDMKLIIIYLNNSQNPYYTEYEQKKILKNPDPTEIHRQKI